MTNPACLQTTVVMGELGVGHTDPAAPALDVLSTLLNGFGGSLFEEIRSRQVRWLRLPSHCASLPCACAAALELHGSLPEAVLHRDQEAASRCRSWPGS